MADKKRPRAPEQTADFRRLTRRTSVFKGLAAAGFGRVAPALRRFGHHLPALTRLSGLLVIAVGVFMIAGAYRGFFVRLIRFVPWTPPL